MKEQARVGITFGDPRGVGTEITAKAISRPACRLLDIPTVHLLH
jgi:4-hydroxy-L-threonine phosphate dehydrogenase PdxA